MKDLAPIFDLQTLVALLVAVGIAEDIGEGGCSVTPPSHALLREVLERDSCLHYLQMQKETEAATQQNLVETLE